MMLRLPWQYRFFSLRSLSSEVHFGPSYDSLQEIMERNLVRWAAVRFCASRCIAVSVEIEHVWACVGL